MNAYVWKSSLNQSLKSSTIGQGFVYSKRETCFTIKIFKLFVHKVSISRRHRGLQERLNDVESAGASHGSGTAIWIDDEGIGSENEIAWENVIGCGVVNERIYNDIIS